MTTTSRAGRAPRALYPLVMAGALGALALTPTCALAATGPSGTATATYSGPGVGYNKVIDGHAAGTVKLQVEGGDVVEAFCIEYGVEMATTGTFTAKTFADSKIKNIAKAADVAVRHEAIAGKLTDARAESTAAQLAIWTLTDGKDISAVPNAAIVARAKALAAAAQVRTEGPSSLAVTATATVTGEGDAAKDTVVAYVKTAAGAGVPGQQVKLVTGTTPLSATTDATGKATFSVDAPDAAVPAKVTLEAKIPAGTVLDPGAKQAMVTTEDATVRREGFVTLPAEPAPKPDPTKTVEETAKPIPSPTQTIAAPKPSPVAPKPTTSTPTEAPPTIKVTEPAPKKLPFTGGWAQPWMLGAALGAAGAGLAGRRFLRRR